MADEAFIPPGQEEVVGAMLGNGGSLPGGCKLVAGHVEKANIKVTYTCASGEVIVELTHPSAAPPDAARTEKFALRIDAGTPPPELQSVLLSRIREYERQFHWTVSAAPDGASAAQPGRLRVLPGAVVLGALVLAALLLWRRYRRPTQD
jgi:hypothetical protein